MNYCSGFYNAVFKKELKQFQWYYHDSISNEIY